MRKIWGLFFFGALIAGAGGASAEATLGGFTCNDYATGLADHTMRDQMVRAGEREHAVAGRVLVIAAGQKFYIPQRQVDDNLAPTSIYARMRAWNDTYDEGFGRCMESGQLFLPAGK